MIKPADFFNFLIDNDIGFFTGVPDSLLKDIGAYIFENAPADRHIIAANEGNAIGLAAGYHLATGRPALVYMQNSGIGNAVNPLASLADEHVYSIPMLLLIGWRGEPGVKDEPQHVKQGQITLSLLDVMGVSYDVLAADIDTAKQQIKHAVKSIRDHKRPYALVIRRGSFEKYVLKKSDAQAYGLMREETIQYIVKYIDPDAAVVSTTGKTSRELYETIEASGRSHASCFLTVGSMGHSSQIALSIALLHPSKKVYCLDGDGAVLMHMGAMPIIGTTCPKNFKHIVLNNGAHDSVGGQPTAAFQIDIPSIARACGYKEALQASTREGLIAQLKILDNTNGPALLEVKLQKGARSDLGRPETTPIQNKSAFMNFLQSTE